MRRMALAACVLTLGLLGAGNTLAEGRRGTGRLYDPATVEAVSGEVVSVQRVERARGRDRGVHLTLDTGKETIRVHIGPDWWVTEHKLALEPHDRVEVRGSRVTVAGQQAIIAAEVKKGDVSFKLRNDAGVPVWAGRGPSRR